MPDSAAADSLTREHAERLDRADPLRRFRRRFYLPPGRTYLDGNSLGPASVDAERALLAALEAWKRLAIEAWTAPGASWFTLCEQLGSRQAALAGAEPREVVVTGSTTVNLHALVATFYAPGGRRTKLVADELNFPSDLYALESQVRLRGRDPSRDLVLVRSRDGRTIDERDVVAALGDDVAVAVLPSVLYGSGQLLDVAALTAAAHERGVLIGFDCSHSVGCVPHALHRWGVDFAFWCNYKYVNGGPGTVASLFVHERHLDGPGTARPALAGWWGSDKRRQFEMGRAFEPAGGAGAWQIGTPPVLSASAIAGALDLTLEAGLERIREKSLRQTEYLMHLADHLLPEAGFAVGTPREPARRGGHVALEHSEALRIARALRQRGIVPDHRPPNVIRLAPVALYTTYVELWETVQALRQIVSTGAHLEVDGDRQTVT